MSEFNSIINSFSNMNSPSFSCYNNNNVNSNSTNNVDTSVSNSSSNDAEFMFQIVGKFNELNTAYNHLQYQFNNSMVQQQRLFDDQLKRMQLLETQYCSLQSNLENMKKLWLSDSSWITSTNNSIWNPQEIQLKQKNNNEDVQQLKSYVVDLHEQLNNLQARFNSMYQQSLLQEQKIVKFTNLSQSLYSTVNQLKSSPPISPISSTSSTTFFSQQQPSSTIDKINDKINECIDIKDQVLAPQQTKYIDMMFVVLLNNTTELPAVVSLENMLKVDVFDLFQDQTVETKMDVVKNMNLQAVCIYLKGYACFFINDDITNISHRYQQLIVQAFQKHQYNIEIFSAYKASTNSTHYEFIHSSITPTSILTLDVPMWKHHSGFFHRLVSLFPNTTLPTFEGLVKQQFSSTDSKRDAYFEVFQAMLIKMFGSISQMIQIKSFFINLCKSLQSLQTSSTSSSLASNDDCLNFVINGIIEYNNNYLHLMIASKFIHKCLYNLLSRYSLSSLTIANDGALSKPTTKPSTVPFMYRPLTLRKDAMEFIPVPADFNLQRTFKP
jgi:hypothetical protein